MKVTPSFVFWWRLILVGIGGLIMAGLFLGIFGPNVDHTKARDLALALGLLGLAPTPGL